VEEGRKNTSNHRCASDRLRQYVCGGGVGADASRSSDDGWGKKDQRMQHHQGLPLIHSFSSTSDALLCEANKKKSENDD
jgi:hypothetical protein